MASQHGHTKPGRPPTTDTKTFWARSKIYNFSDERHFKICFPIMKTINIFRRKLCKLHKKGHKFACDNYIFPKTRLNKSKQWTHYPALIGTACEEYVHHVNAPIS